MEDDASRQAKGLVLEHVHHWERSTPERVYRTQPAERTYG